jgi:putative Ca2+/H+ antiporter (TMEM165/GDT1 family)
MDLGALTYAFGLVFVAELGDKTQLAVVSQTCKYRHPWAIFLGASLALAMVTAIGAAGGEVLARVVPQSVLRTVAAAAFVVMGLLVAREAVKAGKEGDPDGEACPLPEGDQGDGSASSAWNWKAFTSTLGLLFVAELGDKTQLAVLSLASKSGTPGAVFLGGTLALTAVTGLGVLGGQGLCRLIPERVLLWISAAAFVVMGVLMGLGVL